MYQRSFSKVAVLSLLLGIAAITQSVAIPDVKSSNKASSNNGKYHIIVYQNGKCTGQQIPFPEDDQGCQTGLGAGGAGLELLNLDGKLVFYDEPDCAGNKVDTFSSGDDKTGTDCKPLKGNPVSFRFIGT